MQLRAKVDKLAQLVLQLNLFQYYNQAKKLSLIAKELETNFSQSFLQRDLSDKEDILTLDLIFWDYLTKKILEESEKIDRIITDNM